MSLQVSHRVRSLILTLGLCAAGAAQPALAQSGCWSTLPSMPTARSAPCAAAVDGSVYVFGGAQPSGTTTTATEAFDPMTSSWSIKAPAPAARSFASAAVIGTKIYIVGGCLGSDCIPGLTNRLDVYDTVANSWATLAPMPTPRHAASVGVIAGKLYVAGGSLQCGPCNPVTTLEVYDPATNSWTARTPMPVARRYAASAVIGGKLYITAGIRDATNGFENSTVIYNPATNSWSTGAPVPTNRQCLNGGAALSGYFYVVAGYNSGGELTTVEIYDPMSNTWLLQRDPLPSTRSFAAIAAMDGTLYVAGSGLSGTIVEAFSERSIRCPGDLDCDNAVGLGDIARIILRWAQSCP